MESRSWIFQAEMLPSPGSVRTLSLIHIYKPVHDSLDLPLLGDPAVQHLFYQTAVLLIRGCLLYTSKPSTVSSNRKRLAGKSPAQQVEVGHFIGVGFSNVLTEPLSFRIEQRPVALVGIFVDLTMAYADKTSGPAESLPEPADAGKQVNIRYGFGHHTPFS